MLARAEIQGIAFLHIYHRSYVNFNAEGAQMAKPGRPKEHSDERVTTAIRLPKGLYKRLKHEAIDREVSVNTLIEQATKTFLGEPADATGPAR